MSDSGLLIGGYTISEPDFEAHNFTLEMLSAAGALLSETDPVQSSALVSTPGSKNTSHDMVRKAYWEQHAVEIPKGKVWGRALADTLIDTPNADATPIAEQFTHILRGSRTIYRFSTKAYQK